MRHSSSLKQSLNALGFVPASYGNDMFFHVEGTGLAVCVFWDYVKYVRNEATVGVTVVDGGFVLNTDYTRYYLRDGNALRYAKQLIMSVKLGVITKEDTIWRSSKH